MIRRLSTKWVLAVLAAVVVPFVGFAFFVDTRVTDRMAGDVVRFHLLSMAADLSSRIDAELDERRNDVGALSVIPELSWFVEEVTDQQDQGRFFRKNMERIFDGVILSHQVYDYLIAIDRDGRGIGMNTVWADGTEIPAGLVERLLSENYARPENTWFKNALEHGASNIDFHRVDLGQGPGRLEGGWYIGFAHSVESYPPRDKPVGVILALMNWEHIQDDVSSFGVRELGNRATHPVGEDIYESSYAWMWKQDADTIIAHQDQGLYGHRVSELEGGKLAPMIDAAKTAEFGMYPDYEFLGVAKKAAFRHLKGTDENSFGWVLGVGVDKDDIYAPVQELSNWLFTASAVTLLIAVLLTMYIAHRTTRPIRELEQHTRRVGHGDLDARIEVRSRDELGQLAASFNRMTAELKENREQLVQAEKEAAWREMARQVAHEIKNPLTPISLSAGLLRRSRDERSPDFDEILDRTIDMIQRQVENMRDVARDFYAFAGEHRDLTLVDVGESLDAVLELNAALAEERGVRLHRSGSGGMVRADADELQRALLNLVSNAIEAMPDGGDLHTRVDSFNGQVITEIRDTGTGISDEVSDRLFEPHFTTRSSGTGLGLAIVRRIIEDMGGEVELANAEEGRGARARVVLPSEPRSVDSEA